MLLTRKSRHTTDTIPAVVSCRLRPLESAAAAAALVPPEQSINNNDKNNDKIKKKTTTTTTAASKPMMTSSVLLPRESQFDFGDRLTDQLIRLNYLSILQLMLMPETPLSPFSPLPRDWNWNWNWNWTWPFLDNRGPPARGCGGCTIGCGGGGRQ